jgi:pimeloyl-ACP methyl ester carboxylesterase
MSEDLESSAETSPAGAANPEWAESDPVAKIEFVAGEKGRIETISVEAWESGGDLPTLYFLVGWWGSASDYVPVMRFFARLGFRCRSFSWRGTGQSEGRSFWGRGYEPDLLNVLEHFKDHRVVLIPHSGAADYTRGALPALQGRNIEAIVVIAPLARSGSMHALWSWLRWDDSGTNLTRWARFLGSNVLGVTWFMRNELAVRRVLLGDHVANEVAQKVWSQMDACPYGRYFLSLWRFPNFLRPRETPIRQFGIKHALLLHCEHDRNFSEDQQRETAAAFGAEFAVLPATCHQWFADPRSFRTARQRILSWLAEKGLIPEIAGEL